MMLDLQQLLAPPGLYLLIGAIVLLLVVVFLQRKRLRAFFKGWSVGEIKLGALTLKRKEPLQPNPPSNSKAGIQFGENNDFSGAQVSQVAGRDINVNSLSDDAGSGQATSVDFGRNNIYTKAKLDGVAGRDINSRENSK